MYSAILRALPIPTWSKVLLVVAIITGITAVCFLVIFPTVIDYIPFPFGNQGYPTAPDNLQIVETNPAQ
jgi:hypothetical protein